MTPCPVPESSLLHRCLRDGAFADCYVTEIGRSVTHAEFVAAFYTTWVFRLERFILRWWFSKPSTDDEARALAAGTANAFAAWRVEGRGESEILLADFTGRTRSWLSAAPAAHDPSAREPGTRLYFGSAVMPITSTATGRKELGGRFDALLGFHKIYSRVLLRAASARLAAKH